MKEKFRSVANRLTWRIILSTLLTMTIVSGLIFLFAAGTMLVQNRGHFKDVLDIIDERMAVMLNSVEISAVNNVDEIGQHLSNPDEVCATLHDEMRLNPHVVGSAVGFIPDFFPKEGRWYEPYARREAGAVTLTQIGSADHDYFEMDWYKKGFTAEKGIWSDPYIDEVGAKALLSTFLLPVRDGQGRTVGVFGADLSLEWLSDQLKEIDMSSMLSGLMTNESEDPGKDTYSFILGRNGEYLAHPDRSRILHDYFSNHVSASEGKSFSQVARDMVAGKRGEQIVTVDGIRSYVFYAPLLHTGWSMATVVPIRVMAYPGIVIGMVILNLLAIGLLITFLLSRGAIRNTIRPLRQLAVSAEEVARGNFDAPLPGIKHNDEIRQLRDSFGDMQQSLSKYINELTEATAHRVSMERELEIARGIQMAMLPMTFPAFPDRKDIDIFAFLNPAKAVGGDLYDFFIRDGQLYFCIGDVSGKGIPGSLVMGATITQFRTLSVGEHRPETIVRAINETLSARNEQMMFVTLFVGVLDLSGGRLKYCNAGHDAPIVIGPDGSARYLEVQPNLALGVEPEQEFEPQQVQLKPGTTFFLYTDGLSEAENPDHALFGKDRILEAAGKKAKTPEALIAQMSDAVHAFVSGAEQSDDLTMLALRYK